MKRYLIVIYAALFSLLTFSSIIYTNNGSEVSCTGNKSIPESQTKKEEHKRPSPERIYRFEQQEVTVKDFDPEGYILDIGGGGEGVIGQLKGQQVIAIDISKRELEEAPPGPLKIVMDARDLKFLDNSFQTATVFFTFMYIKGADHQKVFEELFRVLATGGRLFIWDVIFPKLIDEKKEVALFPLKVILPNKEITTGYGVHWPEKEQGLLHYLKLAEKTGFKVIAKDDNGKWFYLELRK
ncbi:MAG: class I SAM-dependent methyltransferase [Candidatus Aminicenantaceae bacterium]